MLRKLSTPFALLLLIAGCAAPETQQVAEETEDPYLWLEEVDGEQAIQWAKELQEAEE